MSFTSAQISGLEASLSTANVKKNPRGYDYVEGWHAIAEANRIFGFDAWDRSTVEMNKLGEPEKVGDNWRVAYHCRVRVSVRAGDTVVVRDGSGYGSGIGKDIRDVHESAIKEAETDAMKRALMTFGNPFGLALYDKDKTNVIDDSKAKFIAECEAKIKAQTDAQELRNWWGSDEQKKARRDFELGNTDIASLLALIGDKLKTLEPKKEAA